MARNLNDNPYDEFVTEETIIEIADFVNRWCEKWDFFVTEAGLYELTDFRNKIYFLKDHGVIPDTLKDTDGMDSCMRKLEKRIADLLQVNGFYFIADDATDVPYTDDDGFIHIAEDPGSAEMALADINAAYNMKSLKIFYVSPEDSDTTYLISKWINLDGTPAFIVHHLEADAPIDSAYLRSDRRYQMFMNTLRNPVLMNSIRRFQFAQFHTAVDDREDYIAAMFLPILVDSLSATFLVPVQIDGTQIGIAFGRCRYNEKVVNAVPVFTDKTEFGKVAKERLAGNDTTEIDIEGLLKLLRDDDYICINESSDHLIIPIEVFKKMFASAEASRMRFS